MTMEFSALAVVERPWPVGCWSLPPVNVAMSQPPNHGPHTPADTWRQLAKLLSSERRDVATPPTRRSARRAEGCSGK